MSFSYPFMACSVCFGDPNSLQSRGTMYGIFFLLAVVLMVLGGIAVTAFVWARRAKKLGSAGS